jgi:hypothetical protein
MFSIHNTQGVEVARTVTDASGQATVSVPPGRYVVIPNIEGRFPRGASVEVTVSAGQYVIARIELDTGMR